MKDESEQGPVLTLFMLHPASGIIYKLLPR